MMNPTYNFARMRELLDEYKPSRERSLAATKLDECEMWLAKCEPTDEAKARDRAAAAPVRHSHGQHGPHGHDDYSRHQQPIDNEVLHPDDDSEKGTG